VSQLIVRPGRPLRGSVRVPGDKSISHRALLLGALADGTSRVEGFLPCGDCLATLSCLRTLGVEIETRDASTVTVHGRGLQGLQPPTGPLDCARSGTTMRLLAGILAGQPFTSTLTGREQLLRRPMRRVADPLREMGAEIETDDGCAPLIISGRALRGCRHVLPIASAQVKSALLLAGLYAAEPTTVQQPGPARDHTERMLYAMGAAVDVNGLSVTLSPNSVLRPLQADVPGDISSAAFPLVAAALVAGSEINIKSVGVNPTRTGLLEVLRQMGADITLTDERSQGNEPSADITVRASSLRGIEIGGETVVRMIDEFPVLAVAASQARGTTVVRDAAELRVKETDRIAAIVTELGTLGVNIAALPDGFVVEGSASLRGGVVDSRSDHRLALALAVAGQVADAEVIIEHSECMSDSFPGFVELMRGLGADYD
jgi:3-phosphoshikimate 1-carboxyvinyltransferase